LQPAAPSAAPLPLQEQAPTADALYAGAVADSCLSVSSPTACSLASAFFLLAAARILGLQLFQEALLVAAPCLDGGHERLEGE